MDCYCLIGDLLYTAKCLLLLYYFMYNTFTNNYVKHGIIIITTIANYCTIQNYTIDPKC